jgi:hypothetical protein
MSYHPKKFKTPWNKGPNQNTNFVNRQYENIKNFKDSVILKSFESINEKMKKYSPKKFIADKYKKFSESIKNPENKKLISFLPAVLLSITFLAVKNKQLIRPFIESYYKTSKQVTPNMSMTDKVLLVISEYGNILYNNMNILTTFDAVMTLLILFLEDIPNLISKLDSYKGISALQMQRNIIKNAADLQENLIDKPARERKKKEEEEKRQQKYKEMQEIVRKQKQEKQQRQQQEIKNLRDALKNMQNNPKKNNATKQQRFSEPAKRRSFSLSKNKDILSSSSSNKSTVSI